MQGYEWRLADGGLEDPSDGKGACVEDTHHGQPQYVADAPYEPNLGGTWRFNLKFLRCCDQPIKFVYAKDLSASAAPDQGGGAGTSADLGLTASVRPSLESMKYGDGCSISPDDGVEKLES